MAAELYVFCEVAFPGLGLFGRIYPSVLGSIAVVMGYSAYVSEVLRAGFNDVHPSQRASARSLGLTSGQTTDRKSVV